MTHLITIRLPRSRRLAENPEVKVGVLEAGVSQLGNIVVETPGELASYLSKSVFIGSSGPVGEALICTGDLSIVTTPQSECFGRNVLLPR